MLCILQLNQRDMQEFGQNYTVPRVSLNGCQPTNERRSKTPLPCKGTRCHIMDISSPKHGMSGRGGEGPVLVTPFYLV